MDLMRNIMHSNSVRQDDGPGEERDRSTSGEFLLKRAPTQDEIDDWSDVYKPQDVGEIEPASADVSGIRKTLLPHELELARRQEKAIKTASALSRIINDFFHGLDDPDVKGKLNALIRLFFREIAGMANKYGLDIKNSNVLKMFEGLRYEFESILTAPEFVTKKMIDMSMKVIRRVLSDLDNALLAVRSEGRWESIEEVVPMILHILPVMKGQIADLSVGLLMIETRERALESLIGAAKAVPNPEEVMRQQLDEFARGDVNLDTIFRREEDWGKLMHKAESLPKEGDFGESANEIL